MDDADKSTHERSNSGYSRAVGRLRNDPAGFAVLFARLVLGIASSLGLIGWSFYDLSFLGWIGLPKTAFEFFIIGFPLVYFSGSLIASLRVFPLRTLLIVGILLNSPILLMVWYWIADGYGLAPLSFICWFFLMAWTGLTLARLKKPLRFV